jgi:hypothetical protein
VKKKSLALLEPQYTAPGHTLGMDHVVLVALQQQEAAAEAGLVAHPTVRRVLGAQRRP